MSTVFIKLLNMSITASWMILAVILARLLLKKAPKWITCLLWGLVAVRLICPFSFESIFSLIPSSQTIPSNIALQQELAINSGITIVNETINPIIAESFTPTPSNSANPLQIIIPVASIIWIVGIVILLVYALISYLRLKKSVSVCVPVKEGILSCDEVKAPFILGVFRPIIYVPSSMNGETLDYVLRHESAHLQRRDHWWKPLGFLLLSVYWFNPLCWIAYILLCRDIEMACDEKVIRDMDKGDMAAYSQALLDCSFPRKRIAACPLAFGEVGVKERVKGVLNYKKPAFWIILIAVIACIVLAVCLMTDPFSNKSLSEKLGISMDMAVAEHNHSFETDGHFVAIDYDVLRVSKSLGRTTVYAWVMYEEYSFDGTDVKEESCSHIPTVITFDTSSEDSDKSTYDVIEYWQPRDGSYYSEDIRSKFPFSIWAKAFDVSGADRQHENCLRAAREYFGVDQNKRLEAIFEQYYTIQETTYEDKRSGGTSTIPFSEVRFIEEKNNEEESFYRVETDLLATDFSVISESLSDMIEQEWNRWDNMTTEQRMFSSSIPGMISFDCETWTECEETIGLTIYNPLEGFDWLEKVGYFGMEVPDISHVHAMANASSQINGRELNEITITSGYNSEGIRITLMAVVSSRDDIYTIGSRYSGMATYDHKTVFSESGIPVLVVITDGQNNLGYYNGDYYDPTAYWVRDNVFYTLRVTGERSEEKEIQELFDRIISEI